MTAPLYWSIGVDSGATIGLALLKETRLERGPLSRLGSPEVIDLRSTRELEEALRTIEDWGVCAKNATLIGAVERVKTIYPKVMSKAGGKGIASRMATHLNQSTEVVVECRVALRNLGAHVLELSAAEWRKPLTGSSSPSDALIAAALSKMLGDRQSNAHQRDAIGIARHALIWARTTEGRLALTKGRT